MKCEDCGMYLHPGEIHGSDDCIDTLCKNLNTAQKIIESLNDQLDAMTKEVQRLQFYLDSV